MSPATRSPAGKVPSARHRPSTVSLTSTPATFAQGQGIVSADGTWSIPFMSRPPLACPFRAGKGLSEQMPGSEPEDSQEPADSDTASSPGPVPPTPPLSPLTPEDGLYVAIVSECFGLERAGAGLLRSCLITAGHLMLLGLASGAQPPPKEQA